jgi:hypothetical protein
MGNVLNGGTNKGQADGFDFQVLGKVHMQKDNNGRTFIQYICAKLTEKDASFPENLKRDYKKLNHRGLNLKLFEEIEQECSSKYKAAKGNFDEIIEDGEKDKFVEVMGNEMLIIEHKVKGITGKYTEISKKHEECYKMFDLKESDTITEDKPPQDVFYAQFIGFFKHAVEALPKEEKRRGVGAG